jgi:hypothetical protein
VRGRCRTPAFAGKRKDRPRLARLLKWTTCRRLARRIGDASFAMAKLASLSAVGPSYRESSIAQASRGGTETLAVLAKQAWAVRTPTGRPRACGRRVPSLVEA